MYTVITINYRAFLLQLLERIAASYERKRLAIERQQTVLEQDMLTEASSRTHGWQISWLMLTYFQ